MKTNPFPLVLIWMIAFANLSESFSQTVQEESPVYFIKTRDGNEFIGKIVLEDNQKIILLTEKFGEVTIAKTDIVRREIIIASRLVDGVLWADNPQATRYFFGPNGHGIKKGEGYYQNVWIFFNQFTVGLD